jgi:methionine biosynthesis protein MetW
MKEDDRYSDEQTPTGERLRLLDLVPSGSRVLDIGCWTGYNGHVLIQRGCTVVGVENNERAAHAASAEYHDVIIGDVEKEEIQQMISGSFDAILLLDVLEHLRDPGRILHLGHKWAPTGLALVSVPNVAHWSIRRELLRGRWRYTPTGILDSTHLRFYTVQTATNLLEESGWHVTRRSFPQGPLPFIQGTSALRSWVTRRWPRVFAVQTLLAATSSSSPDQTPGRR